VRADGVIYRKPDLVIGLQEHSIACLTPTQALVDGSSALGPRVGRIDCLVMNWRVHCCGDDRDRVGCREDGILTVRHQYPT
jgi:hypothetical protein